MKKLLLIIAFFFIFSGATISEDDEAYAYTCFNTECMFSVHCGPMCYCAKGSYDVKGVCISK